MHVVLKLIHNGWFQHADFPFVDTEPDDQIAEGWIDVKAHETYKNERVAYTGHGF